MNRRNFIAAGVATSFLDNVPDFLMAQVRTAREAACSIDLSGIRVPLPADFTGLSYESAQLSHPGYFSAQNKTLVALVRQVGRQGVLRIGGNTSDYDEWKPERVARASDWDAPEGPDTGSHTNKLTSVTENAIDELRTFLDATGWKLLYGIDLGHGSLQSAADEAAYVVKKIGPALLALQIGNEADQFYRNGIRKPTYGYADYFAEWQRFADAIRERTPDAPLAGPDTGGHIDWVESFAKQARSIRLLTSHYYAEGPPNDPKVTIGRLLGPHQTNRENMQRLVALGKSVSIPYRMSECNSCYRGGKSGVSDTFAAALWGADYMMSLAQWGVAGINFHGGGQGFYTPIAGGGDQPLVPRPLFYGMAFFRQFARGSMVPVLLNADKLNLSAYASLSLAGKLQIAIVNKEQSVDAHLSISVPGLRGAVRSIALCAPAIDTTAGITLGGSSITSDGAWRPRHAESLHAKSSGLSLVVPKASAILLTCETPLQT